MQLINYFHTLIISTSLIMMSMIQPLSVCAYEIQNNQTQLEQTQLQQTQLNSYSLSTATNGVWLSGASYCDKDHYKTMQLGGPVSDFKYTDTIYDLKSDIQGFVGILPSTKSIYVVFRGSSSTLNWLDDFEVKLVSYDTYPECGCKVHSGFYHTTLAIKDQVINSINRLKKIYPTYDVMFSGHSLGAIISLMTAMELKKVGINSQTYNYGQPRGGDKIFASFVNSNLGLSNYYRYVHNKDMVPHTPPIEGFGYYHSCTEIWENANGSLKTCSTINCEDPTCSDQFSLVQTNTADHSIYLGHVLSCESSTI